MPRLVLAGDRSVPAWEEEEEQGRVGGGLTASIHGEIQIDNVPELPENLVEVVVIYVFGEALHYDLPRRVAQNQHRRKQTRWVDVGFNKEIKKGNSPWCS